MIRTIRQKKKITTKKLAKQVGISPQHLNNIERGGNTTIAVLKRIGDALDVPYEVILFSMLRPESVSEEKAGMAVILRRLVEEVFILDDEVI